ncbi:hypothetical protein CONCODRAFT_8955 [Conidiobolus coronatus NRRL 28638]|uniref:Uncharacterized protein n=1 Tax=Conidiobolus coronatus (strain ATCC 28846 / CBS 209.66 / NRRL 28638) TaxID=796925 RepID=A0A137P1I7_CONC2|nr:hypothetical protein CONCODRAFT_8955 [Conidiobolus coronatus NRRL 28638]|eukprot:KXN68744.1 hypothetical protein CONCODRAFT_8955 [Conidiobolus coronatus NRRL 28638]
MSSKIDTPEYNETNQMSLSSAPESVNNRELDNNKGCNPCDACLSYQCSDTCNVWAMVCGMGVLPFLCFPCIIVYGAVKSIATCSLCTNSTPNNNNGL